MVLTRDTLEGVYAFIPMPWDDNDELDVSTLRHDVSYLANSPVDGVYALDSTGEFFTLELPEFRRAVDVLVDAAGDKPLQINCTWSNRTGALERASYASDRGADAIRFAFPFWEAVTVDEGLEFMEELAEVSEPAPLIHYNIQRAKLVFGTEEYKRAVERVPQLIGTKLANDERTIIEILAEIPELKHFVGEPHFVPMMAAGATGSYCWLGTMNPRLMSEWYESCVSNDWNRAIEIQRMVWAYSRKRVEAVDVHTDAGYNKVDAAINPNINCGVGIRGPYRSASSSDVMTVRDWAEENTPEMVKY